MVYYNLIEHMTMKYDSVNGIELNWDSEFPSPLFEESNLSPSGYLFCRSTTELHVIKSDVIMLSW